MQPPNPSEPQASDPGLSDHPHSQRAGGLSAFIWSFGYAAAGVAYLLRTQRNARVHVLAAAGVTGIAAWLKVPSTHWAILLLTFALIVSLEAVNTAIEATVDLASPEHASLAKIGKDVGAAAVLIASIFAVGVGLLLLGPPLLSKLGWIG